MIFCVLSALSPPPSFSVLTELVVEITILTVILCYFFREVFLHLASTSFLQTVLSNLLYILIYIHHVKMFSDSIARVARANCRLLRVCAFLTNFVTIDVSRIELLGDNLFLSSWHGSSTVDAPSAKISIPSLL